MQRWWQMYWQTKFATVQKSSLTHTTTTLWRWGGCRRNFTCGNNNNQIVVSPVLVSTLRFKESHSNYVIPSVMRFFFTLLLNLKQNLLTFSPTLNLVATYPYERVMFPHELHFSINFATVIILCIVKCRHSLFITVWHTRTGHSRRPFLWLTVVYTSLEWCPSD